MITNLSFSFRNFKHFPLHTILDMHAGMFPECNFYIVHDGVSVFYVGQSEQVVRRVRSHITKTINGYRESKLGGSIVVNMPTSLHWTVEFLTLADCKPFIKNVFGKVTRCDNERVSRLHAEEALIRFFHPILNKMENEQPSSMPIFYLAPQVKEMIEPGETDNLY